MQAQLHAGSAPCAQDACTPDRDTGSPAPRARGLLGDATFAMFARVLYLATRLALPPMILARVSLSEYGLWAACFVLVAYVALADMGLSSVYVRFVARLHGRGDTDGIGRLLSTGIVSMFAIGSVVFGAVVLSLDPLMGLLKIEPALRPAARVLVVGSVGVFVLDMALSAFGHALHGLRRVRSEQKVWMVSFLLEFALIVAFLQAGLGVNALLTAFALRTVFALTANMVLLRRALPGLRVGPRRFDASMLRHFAGFGLSVQASTLLSVALHSADRMIAGVLLGPSAIALFDLGGKLPLSAASIPSTISRVTLPQAAALAEAGGPQERRTLATLYSRATRSVALIAAVPLGFMAAFAAPLCLAWLGPRPELQALPTILSACAVGALFHVITGPGSAVFRGMGLVGNEFLYSALRIVLIAAAIALAWATIGHGASAIAIGLAAGTVIAALVYNLHNHRRLQLPARELLTAIVLPSLAPLAVALSLLVLWQMLVPVGIGRFALLGVLAGFGAVHCLVCGALLWRWLRADERDAVLRVLRRRT